MKWLPVWEVALTLGYTPQRIRELASAGVWVAYQLPELPSDRERKRHVRPWRIQVDDSGRPILAPLAAAQPAQKAKRAAPTKRAARRSRRRR